MDVSVSARASGSVSSGVSHVDAYSRAGLTVSDGGELDTLQARAASGQLSPVEQGTLARLMDRAGGGAAPGAAKAPKAHSGPKTAADFTITGGTKQDKTDLNTALKYLQQTDSSGKAVSPTATKLIAKMKEGATIHIIHDGNDSYDPSTGVLNWDPKSGLKVTSGQGIQSAALGLVHEMDHEVSGTVGKPTGDGYQNTEEKRVIAGSETTIAHDLHEPTRTDHYGSTVVMTTANAHTDVTSGKVVDGAVAARAATKH
ncbi:hypothetical protein HZF05_14930 [Sphingomonas sp. CGMCC 1.13654]|uniref:Uncharacterized protein n=1 Tax=Sphingomonas chungangi TaxID=2683589 RepID=A0A838L9Y0_9SPHN|nr:hypothetical protein [Sphingomonas chungangi]MBA2935379.1 hypothetical protein [Sphingomonas chungangi]MVW56885.1 hypothetical protein [Sphingomonas chungangi]